MRVTLAICLAASGAWASDLVGPIACRACHAEAYRIWSESAHARAAKALGAERKRPLCLQCHSRDEERAGQEVQGVSCETCHGGGRYYQPAVVMRDKELARLFGLVDPTPQSCKVCHGGESPSLRTFDVTEAMKRIDHWTADRGARKASASLPVPKGVPAPAHGVIVSEGSDRAGPLSAWLREDHGLAAWGVRGEALRPPLEAPQAPDRRTSRQGQSGGVSR